MLRTGWRRGWVVADIGRVWSDVEYGKERRGYGATLTHLVAGVYDFLGFDWYSMSLDRLLFTVARVLPPFVTIHVVTLPLLEYPL